MKLAIARYDLRSLHPAALLSKRRAARPHCSRCGRFCALDERAPEGESGDVIACTVCDLAPADDAGRRGAPLPRRAAKSKAGREGATCAKR
jgi:hypothetical protein